MILPQMMVDGGLEKVQIRISIFEIEHASTSLTSEVHRLDGTSTMYHGRSFWSHGQVNYCNFPHKP